MSNLRKPAATRHLFAPLLLAAQLVGCGGHSVAPVQTYAHYQNPRGDTHTVNRGDTLYSIAWAYGVDYRELAARNGISEPYTIYPGQRLDVRRSSKRPAARGETRSRGAPTRTVTTAPKRSANTTAAPKTVKSSPEVETQKPRSSVKSTARKPPAPTRATKIRHWTWPAKGQIVTDFASSGSKGVDISGRVGQPVVAAADGRVVYAGGGLRGYGELIIVKHNKRYLSAYAHNNRILVKEGDEVKIGQRIAEMGSTGTDSVRLHFEIRRDGKPVNPVRYLPR